MVDVEGGCEEGGGMVEVEGGCEEGGGGRVEGTPVSMMEGC